jgi:hypothetical protein
MLVIALLMPAALLVALVRWVRGVRPRPLSLAAAAAFGLLVALETLLLRALSLGHQVTPPAVVLGHLLLLAFVLWTRPARRGRPSHLPRLPAQLRSWTALVPMALLLLVSLSMVRYAPNNLDALNYHLARVAYWMQNRSVGLYQTSIPLQNVAAAGAEYLLLVFQSISGSDRLTGVLQLGCCALVVCSAPALARLGGASNTVSRWAWLFPISLPMAVLQATSGQNDLVAAALAVACVAALLPFFHRGEHRTPSWGDALIAGLVLGATATTKMTAAVSVAPFVFLALIIQLVRLGPSPAKARLATVARALLVGALALLLLGLESDRLRAQARLGGMLHAFSYVGTSEWADRALNSLRGVFREIPAPWGVSRAIRLVGCPEGEACLYALRPHEDGVGQPIQVAIVLLALVLLPIRWKHLEARTRAFTLCLPIGWLVFHAVFRDNPWVSRLHLPLFALAPLGFGVLHGLPVTRTVRAIGALVAALAILSAVVVANENERRPPFGHVASYAASYYEPQIEAWRAGHDRALAAATAIGCRHLQLRLQDPGCEYPLVWKAMRAGIDVHHVGENDSAACLIYRSPTIEPPPAADWIPMATEPAEALVYRRR